MKSPFTLAIAILSTSLFAGDLPRHASSNTTHFLDIHPQSGEVIETLSNEYPCEIAESNSERQQVQITLEDSGKIGNYYGVSIYGDIVHVENNKVNLHLCSRAGLNLEATRIYTKPFLSPSSNCSVSEVVALDVVLTNTYNQAANVGFFPINYSAPSSLCLGMDSTEEKFVNNEELDNTESVLEPSIESASSAVTIE